MGTALDEARAHVACGDLGAALEATLEVWRATRAPEVAAVVNLVSDRILAGRGREVAGIRDPQRWLAAEPSAEGVGRLAPTLFAAKQLEARARFERALAFPPDPRMAQALARGLLEPPWVGRGMQPVWQHVFTLCVRHAEPGLVATLEALAANEYRRGTARDTNVWMTAECAAAARAGRAFLAGLPAPDAAALAALTRELAATERGHAVGARSEQELLDAIWANPASDDERLVYTDFLLERGDPRGELLALTWKELRGEATDADRARAAALVARHLRALLGPLAGGVDPATAVFERGFLAGATIAIRLKKDVQRLHGHPAWSTLRELRPPTDGQPLDPGFWGTGVLRDLRTVWGLDAPSGRALLSRPPPRLEALGVELAEITGDALAPLEHLRELHVATPRALGGAPLAEFVPVLASARARALARLVLGAFEPLDAWLPFLRANDPGCPELVKAPAGAAAPGTRGPWFTLRHDARGERTVLEVRYAPAEPLPAARERNVDDIYRITATQLDRLPPGLLTELRFVTPPPGAAQRAAVAAATRRQPLAVLALPAAR